MRITLRKTEQQNKLYPLKLAVIFLILTMSLIGVALPILGKEIPALRQENDVFFAVKSLATGVILATGFVHMLSDVFDSLTRACGGFFSFNGFVAMVSAVGTMMVDAFVTGFYRQSGG